MANAALLRYIHQRVLEQADRQARGILDPDRPMVAISAATPDKTGIYILVNETKNGIQWAAVYKSTSPGTVVYCPEEVRDEARGDSLFETRAREYAITYTHIPAVTRKYPKKESPK